MITLSIIIEPYRSAAHVAVKGRGMPQNEAEKRYYEALKTDITATITRVTKELEAEGIAKSHSLLDGEEARLRSERIAAENSGGVSPEKN